MPEERLAKISRQMVQDTKPDTGETQAPLEEHAPGVLELTTADIVRPEGNLSITSPDVELGQEAGENPEASPGVEAKTDKDVNTPEKFKGKSLEEVLKSYTELEKFATTVSQENVSLKQSSTDNKEAPAQDKPIELPEGIEDLMFSNPKEAVKQIAEAVSNNSKKNLSETQKKTADKEDQDKTIEWLRKEHKDIVSDPKLARILDGLAMTAEGNTYMEKYAEAVTAFSSMANDFKTVVTQEVKEKESVMTEMKEGASLPSGSSSNAKGGKIYKQSEVDALILTNPMGYESIKADYTKAMNENRVRRDL